MTKLFKAFPFEMKLNEDKRTVEGYASTFGNKDLVGDVVTAGAFAKTIAERKEQVKLLWQHWEPLGKPVRMSEDSKGLHVEAYISRTQLGNDALELVKDGVIDKFSIGYDVIKDEYDSSTQTRYLKELRLHEFSLVTFPANPEAGVSGLKNYDMLNAALKQTAGMDVTRLLKEGRKLSSANVRLIENAIEALQSVLSIAEPERTDDEKTLLTTLQNTDKPLLNKLEGMDTKELAAILENMKIK